MDTDITVELTADECNMLIQTIETASYPGKFAHLVVALLTKLKPPVEENEETD